MRQNNKMDMSITEQIVKVSDRVCHEICKYYDTGKDLTDEELSEFMREHCVKCPIMEL